MQNDFDETIKPRVGYVRQLARTTLLLSSLTSYPIIINKVSKHIPNLQIDGTELENEISGMQITYNGKHFIRYNKKQPVKRTRFTVAHELGHLLLGHSSPCSKGDLSSINVLEVEANQFAAELLMPLHLLKIAIKKYHSIPELAKAFWVSEEAMSWRIMSTSLYKDLNSWR